MPEKYDLYKSDAGAEIVFKVDEVNDGVYLSDLNAYLITLGVEEERNKYLLNKSVENNVLSLSFSVSKLVTSKSGKVTAQIVFESVGGEVIYHTMIFYISVKNSVSGYAEPSEPLPSAITTLQNSLSTTIEQCKELKTDYLKQAEEYRSEKAELSAKFEKLTPHYALIEKIIVGYSLLETEPEDFTTNYSSYYKTNGKARNDIDFAYLALTEAETFETGKYYSKATESVAINRSGSGNYEPDGTRYAFNNVYAYIDSAANFKGSVFFQYYSIPSHVLLNRVYLDSSAAANTHIVQFSVDAKGNMAIAEAAALVDNDKSKTIGTSKNIVKDENFYLAGFYISPLQVDTTVLIYGVRI